MPPASHSYEYDDWPVQGREDSDVAYVGQTVADQSGNDPGGISGSVFYDVGTGTLFSADVDRESEQIVPAPDTELDVSPGETLGEALERVGEETGWDSLSEFAQDHLEDDE